MGGHLGFYRDGWKLLALQQADDDVDHLPRWRLYDVRADPTELDDVAASYPDKVAELAAAWQDAAWHNTVFPLLTEADRAVRRPEEQRLSRPVRLLPRTPTLDLGRHRRPRPRLLATAGAARHVRLHR